MTESGTWASAAPARNSDGSFRARIMRWEPGNEVRQCDHAHPGEAEAFVCSGHMLNQLLQEVKA